MGNQKVVLGYNRSHDRNNETIGHMTETMKINYVHFAILSSVRRQHMPITIFFSLKNVI